MTRDRKSPQQKKAMEYTRDHVYSGGESVHAFRKTWPRKKARINREYRRKSVELLSQAKPGISAQDAEVAASEVTATQVRKSVSRKRLTKWGPISVGEAVKRKLERRVEKAGSKVGGHKKNQDTLTEALKTLNSLEGDQLVDAARRAFQFNCTHGYREKFALAQSKNSVDQALYVFSEICFDNRYLCGNGNMIASLRRNPALCTEFWRWVEKYEHVLMKGVRKRRQKPS